MLTKKGLAFFVLYVFPFFYCFVGLLFFIVSLFEKMLLEVVRYEALGNDNVKAIKVVVVHSQIKVI